MYKLLDFLWLLVVVMEFLVLIITFYYLRREYAKVLGQYSENIKNSTKQSYVTKDVIDKGKVTMNITQCIDSEEINRVLEKITLLFCNGESITVQKEVGNKIRIGRDPRNDIKINDISVSRRQCIIDINDDGYVIRNFSEINVTQVNGKKVKRSKKIASGDIIKIGNQEFKFINAS